MTTHSTHGNSSASGMSSHHTLTQTLSMQALKTRRSSEQRMAVNPGMNSQDYAGTAQAPSGHPAPAAWDFTLLFLIQKIQIESTLRSPRPVHSGLMIAGRHGSPSTRDSPLNIFPTRMPKLAIVFTASQCINHALTCCTCRNTGTSCARITPVNLGQK